MLVTLFGRVFEAEEAVPRAAAGEGTIVLGAFDQGELVGGLAAYELHLLSGATEIYLYDIAVDTRFQRRGIGRALMRELERHAAARGASTIFVEAEADDSDAVEFYRSLGGEELAVRHFNFPVRRA